MHTHSPIGIFDSGIGGLTVVKAVMETLPDEHIVYFGDTARVPYGIKSVDTVRRYALEITDFLLEKKVKMILIACNTVSASARSEIIQRASPIPVLDVITAGVNDALAVSPRTGEVAVIGTLATIGSRAYQSLIKKEKPEIRLHAKACPMLVPLAEEGWTDNSIALDTLKLYLNEWQHTDLDSLILGCTHYPLFKQSIAGVLDNSQTQIIDSAASIAHMARKYLEAHDLLNGFDTPEFECYVSDRPQRFRELAQRFLGRDIPNVHIVELSH